MGAVAGRFRQRFIGSVTMKATILYLFCCFAIICKTYCAIPTPSQYEVKGLKKFGASGKPLVNTGNLSIT